MARAKVVARPTGRPVIPVHIEHDTAHVLVRSDGSVRHAVEIGFTDEQVGRMKAGYICAKCYEDLDTAFPDECPVCHFPMAERQAELFAKRFEGTKWVGPTTSLDEEYEIMHFLREKELRDRQQVWTPSITVPRSL